MNVGAEEEGKHVSGQPMIEDELEGVTIKAHAVYRTYLTPHAASQEKCEHTNVITMGQVPNLNIRYAQL